jgi:nicotinamidase/pyrazinamidase
VKEKEYAMKEETIFWDVDTQYDFMQPDGKLYVPGAETIIGNVSDVRRYALESGYSMVADIDWHSRDNEEISETPDFKETFPPHCMAGERGSERVGFLGDVPIKYISIEEMDDEAIRSVIRDEPFHVVIRKNSLNVFENPNTNKLVKLIRPKKVIVFGVALDFCVYYVVQGLSKFPDIRICVLKDAVKGLDARPEQEIFDEFEGMGVEIRELDALVGRV